MLARLALDQLTECSDDSVRDMPCSPTSTVHSDVVQVDGTVSAITLQPVLTSLAPGWNQLSPQLYAIWTFQPRHVDSTYAPARELMWLRTTLVKRVGGTWELEEYAQAISDVNDLCSPIASPSTVEEVITLAHAHAVPPETLGFNMTDDELPQRVSDALSPALPGYRESPSGHGVAVEVHVEAEVPAAPGAEVPEVERDTAFVADSDDAVWVDGVQYSLDDTLKHLREACTALGLSKSGSKKICFKRLLEHVKHQELIAAHSATSQVASESQRLPLEQSKPAEPTQAVRDAQSCSRTICCMVSTVRDAPWPTG